MQVFCLYVRAVYVDIKGVCRLHRVLLLPVPVNGVSMCIAIQKPSEKACSLAFLSLPFFFFY